MAQNNDTTAISPGVLHFRFDRKDLPDEILLKLYRGMKCSRMIEEKMLVLLRQGKISKWFAGIGQEAIAAGATLAMHPEEFILPMHRNLGVFVNRQVPLERLFAQFMGKAEGFTHGRDRSFHFGSVEHRIVGMISHLAAQLGVADGIGLAEKLRNSHRAVLAFTGEGATSEGDFHEALNVAAVWDLPVIFLIENNGYGLSTPVSEQYRCASLALRAQGYGMEGYRIFGNDVLEVYHTIASLAGQLRENPRPVLVECVTFRIRGHEEASGTKYVPPELIKEWEARDPVENYEQYLLSSGIIDQGYVETVTAEFKEQIDRAWKTAENYPPVKPDPACELNDVYAPANYTLITPGKSTRNKRYVDAISEGLALAMEKHANLILMGQDIAEYGGVFKVTEGFVERFGKARVRNTPLCESAIIGSALGLSIAGMKSVVEMQFADFVSCGFNQIVNNLAKVHYRWGQHADVVIRMPTGAGVAAGPFHSQSNEAWFFHVPGLKIVFPATPSDAKGLLLSAIDDPNPVMYFEHKKLYRSLTGDVPEGYYHVPIGAGQLVRQGEDATVITYGMGLHWAMEVLDKHPEARCDLIDLRSLLPFDWPLIASSVKKTGKVIILHEDTLTGGIGAELAARIAGELFEYLDGPVVRVASLDTPVPFAPPLEESFLPAGRFEAELLKLLAY